MWVLYFFLIMFVGAIIVVVFKALGGLKNFMTFVGFIAAICLMFYLMIKSVILGFAFIAVFVLLLIIGYKMANKDAERIKREKLIEEENERKRRNRAQFYDEYIKGGFNKKISESKQQRLLLLAQKYDIAENEIDDVIKAQRNLLDSEKKEAETKAAKEEADKIERAKQEKLARDTAEQQKMKTPYPYFGQEKKIAVWQEKLVEVNKRIAAFEEAIKDSEHNRTVALKSDYFKMESKVDPYVAGGIGSAIGGAGAGMMAAFDAMAQNAKTEIENENKAKLYLEYAKDSIILQKQFEEAKRLELKNRREYEKEIKEIKLKLVDEIKIENPMQLFKIHKSNVAENNFEIELSLKKKAIIFGDVKAVIDGAFWAHIYQEKDYVGSVRVILPYDGISNKKSTVCVETSLGINSEKDCYIEYEAETLWFIEE